MAKHNATAHLVVSLSRCKPGQVKITSNKDSELSQMRNIDSLTENDTWLVWIRLNVKRDLTVTLIYMQRFVTINSYTQN